MQVNVRMDSELLQKIDELRWDWPWSKEGGNTRSAAIRHMLWDYVNSQTVRLSDENYHAVDSYLTIFAHKTDCETIEDVVSEAVGMWLEARNG